jgi:ribosomal-protein-serine acetyltransferase
MKFDISPTLYLRLLQPEDAAELFAVVDENRDYLRQWLPWLDANIAPADSLAFIKSIHLQLDAGKGFACGMFWHSKLVGMCGYHEIDAQNQSVVIGYWLAQAWQGNGIVSRCTSFFISYAFNELCLRKVLIPVAEQNNRSRAVCERLGLMKEGTTERAEWLYDRWVNHVCYSITADQWSEDVVEGGT